MKQAPAKCCPSCGERYDADVLFCPRDGTPLASARSPSFSGAERDLYLGVELAGQIQLKHLIGIGSMGRVYRAFQGGIDRDVAVKILHRELSGNAELVRRFHREAKVASRLVHPNVVQVLMTGSVPGREDIRLGGELYLVMEFLDGISLLSALAAAGAGAEGAALPLPRALHIALQICDAVGEAHAQGIVHRDLKPENVMLVRRGDDHDYVKVLDFGIARLDWGDKSMATQAGLIFGTAKYISPEGAEGLPVTPPADVYSIATMLYQCLAGRTPFEGDSHVALLVQHAHTPPPSLKSIPRASYVPAPIESVIMRNLAKKAADRAPDARAFGRDLVTAARESGLLPEAIISHSTLVLGASPGAVKLASKERTKSLELSAEVASKIGSVAARPSDPVSADALLPPARESGEGPAASAAAIEIEQAPLPAPSLGTPTPLASSSPRAPIAASEVGALGKSSPSHKAVSPSPLPPSALPATDPAAGAGATTASPIALEPEARSSGGGELSRASSTTPVARPAPDVASPDLDLAGGAHLGGPALPSTIQGTETTLEPELEPEPRPRRTRFARIATVLVCAAAAAMVIVAGGRGVGGFGAPASRDTIEAHLDDARDCMRRHAWDAPAEPNVKDITGRAIARWPDDARLKDLRREAAERVVADALGRRYAGDTEGALRLAKLALEFSPALTTAQHMVAELSKATETQATPKASADPNPGEKSPKAAPRKSVREPGKAVPDTKPPRTGGATPGPALPPPPPPLPTTGTSPPASTGPWL